MRYPGGKGKSFQKIINLMPPHETYIESHLGGGSVLRNKNPAQKNIGIEKDPIVVKQWALKYPNICEIIEADATSFLRAFPCIGNELIYADPPYLPETRKRKRVYNCDLTNDDHESLLGTLLTLPCMVMVSGYNSNLYNDMLNTWRKVTFLAKAHDGQREECVWLNFPPAKILHDSRYIGQTFRDRQTIKRRQQRLKEKFQKMDPIERNEFIQWLNSTY